MLSIKRVVVVVMAVAGSEIAWQLWKKWKIQNAIDNNNEKKKISEVLLFSDQSSYCRNHANSRKACGKNMCAVANVNRLVHYMSMAKKTLDLSMYIITCHDLVDAAIKVRENNVCVRAIIDTSMAGNSVCGDQINRMRRAGIIIQIHGSNASLMHHKFAIIDEEIMIYGSTNWTMQAFYGNYDSILITNDDVFVKAFFNEFVRIWKK
ncbi:hypothetical protein HCN44_008641 [Aphidius gifuensis]|uniref:Mitochondrial cardiolipin hydrolase n=1 Tax=Aphidius gifuensis TaxID=684658 RepID=A0A834XNC8_APHGI|nr:mitochondrial cardiolipin hydrolase [Aphidius gifuensis]KAF7989967.1 hypothetical protein HCN44_008641 [Aphidius gifuensis]